MGHPLPNKEIALGSARPAACVVRASSGPCAEQATGGPIERPGLSGIDTPTNRTAPPGIPVRDYTCCCALGHSIDRPQRQRRLVRSFCPARTNPMQRTYVPVSHLAPNSRLCFLFLPVYAGGVPVQLSPFPRDP